MEIQRNIAMCENNMLVLNELDEESQFMQNENCVKENFLFCIQKATKIIN